MAVTLPGRAGPVNLPGPENVPTVGLQSDPGLNAPQTAFGPDFGGAADGLDDFAQRLTAAQDRRLARDEAVGRAKARTSYAEKANAELRRLETEDDLSDDQVVAGFAKFLAENKAEAINSHQGGEDSLARLDLALEDVRYSLADRAAIKAAGARQAVLENTFGTELNSLAAATFDRPDDLGGAFESLDNRIDDMAPGLTPEQEMQFRADGRKALTKSAVDGYMIRGDVETAEEMYYGLSGVRDTLGPAEQRQYESRFASYRQQQGAAQRAAQEKLVIFEIINGRPPTPAERLHISGMPVKQGPQSFTDKVNDLEKALKRPLTQPELEKYAGIDAENPLTDAGKLVEDRARFVRQYGEGSEQVQAFDEANKPEVDLTAEAGMRKEFTGQSKDFIQLRDAFNKIEAGAEDATGASDMSLIFSYMKILDPGSTVREGEFASAEKATGVPARILNLYNKTLEGTFLTPEQRKQFVGQAGKLMQAQLKSQVDLETRYRAIAKDSGLTPDRVVVDYVGDLRDTVEQKPEKPAAKVDVQGNFVNPPIPVPDTMQQADLPVEPIPASEMSDEELQAAAIKELEAALQQLKGGAQ